jgi:hypothetical protein
MRPTQHVDIDRKVYADSDQFPGREPARHGAVGDHLPATNTLWEFQVAASRAELDGTDPAYSRNSDLVAS